MECIFFLLIQKNGGNDNKMLKITLQTRDIQQNKSLSWES